jgi:hypothetical protein
MGTDVAERVVGALGIGGTRELLDVLMRSNADRAELIGRLHLREDATWLSEFLIDIEEDELVRLQIVDALRRTLGV